MSSTTQSKESKVLCITGGSGFIGLHISRRLKARGDVRIRIVDYVPIPAPMIECCDEFFLYDLRDLKLCRAAMQGVHTVFHFAANSMEVCSIPAQAGVGAYAENHTISTNVIQASVEANVARFFYASSWGTSDDLSGDGDRVWPSTANLFRPLGADQRILSRTLLNLEKKSTETLLEALSIKMSVTVFRFHGIYGPGGGMDNAGCNLAMSLLEHARARKHGALDTSPTFEIRGRKDEAINLLYIDDAVDAVMQVLDGFPRESGEAFDIVSDKPITLIELAQTSFRVTGSELDLSSVRFHPLESRVISSSGTPSPTINRPPGWALATPLETGLSKTLAWMDEQRLDQVTLDVIIPCYRVDIPILDRVLALKASRACKVMFIVIIDDPASPSIASLEHKYSHRPDVRILVNESNVGASASRNRGLKESTADWVHFLDDDIVPQNDLLQRDEEAIRAHPRAAGFVGTTSFPCAENVFTTAVLLTGMLYLWDIADGKLDSEEDMPWGVTANLIVRRNIPGEVKFNLMYPKTGGGEDIQFCREQRDVCLRNGREAFFAAPKVRVVHPWWKNGKRSYWRFYNLSFGDGALVKQFPQHTYRDVAPNSAESGLLCAMGAIVFAAIGRRTLVSYCLKALASVFLANVLHSCYQHFVQHPERNKNLNLKLRGHNRGASKWVLAVLESSLILMFSECGRLHGILKRREFASLGRRFDWFSGRIGFAYISEDKQRSAEKQVISLLLFFILSLP